LNSLLIIGHTFPEPTTTAAGTRMAQLIEMFQKEGYAITFASTASISEKSLDLAALGVVLERLILNDPSFDVFIKTLRPTLVLFDRFITEEQFGWRVAECCPEAFRILDTEDLHFLRNARQKALKETGDAKNAGLFTDASKREVASILRCDLSLIISEFEMELLKKTFSIAEGIIYYLPFMTTEIPKPDLFPSFEQRAHFMTIGNLLHAPNVDSVLYLKKEIWPLIKKQLPNANMYVYGNYAPQHIKELHNEKEGFFIKGWIFSVKDAMESAKVCLAPIRFGAGLKGKLLDAMLYGTPAVTTTIGAEAMYGRFHDAGGVADSPEAFAALSIGLYSDKIKWQQNTQKGFAIIKERYTGTSIARVFMARLDDLKTNLTLHRQKHFMGQIIQHQGLQATKYLSKWIEEKNKK
jgi:glycosyltransferase involved in cell wall biosynthesis